MSGDEKIRTCAQCNLKVHNLSSMNERAAALVLKKRQSERTCVYFRRKDDGTIAVDNCPEKFKNARNQICIVVASLLICTAQAIYLSSAHAGSLVVHEAFSNFHLRPSDFADHRAFGLDRYPNDLHHMIEFGYDSALEFSRSITAISMILVASSQSWSRFCGAIFFDSFGSDICITSFFGQGVSHQRGLFAIELTKIRCLCRLRSVHALRDPPRLSLAVHQCLFVQVHEHQVR